VRCYLSSYCTYCILVCLYTNHIDSYMGYEHLSAVLIRALPSNQKRAVHEDLNTVSNIRFYPISNSSKSNLTITLLKPIQLHLNCSKLCFTAIAVLSQFIIPALLLVWLRRLSPVGIWYRHNLWIFKLVRFLNLKLASQRSIHSLYSRIVLVYSGIGSLQSSSGALYGISISLLGVSVVTHITHLYTWYVLCT